MSLFEAIFEQKVRTLPFSADVITCSATTSLDRAIDLMATKGIGSLVIVDADRPVGIFTERDVLKKVAGKKLNLETELIRDFMTPNPVCISHDTAFIKIMAAMRLGKFRHLVITNAEGKLAGVISVKDVVNVMVDKFNEIAGV